MTRALDTAYRARAVPGLRTAPITHAEANAYLERFHRHNGRLPGSILRVGAIDETGLVRGVAIAGLPKARLLMTSGVIEVNRVCSDGGYNVCTMLYAACIRAAKALGYTKAVTYTLESELGTSLRAAGWTQTALGTGGGWDRPNLAYRHGQRDVHDLGPKWRWEIVLASPLPEIIWPVDEDMSPMLDFGS